MTPVTYQIVRHDDGWAYKVNGVFSEPYPTHAEALAAARIAAAEQRARPHGGHRIRRRERPLAHRDSRWSRSSGDRRPRYKLNAARGLTSSGGRERCQSG